MSYLRLLSALPVFLILCTPLQARPLLTEEVETVGKFTFEAEGSAFYREDQFESPTMKYKTLNLPAELRFGVTNKVDVVAAFTHLSQTQNVGTATFEGSKTAAFSTSLKVSPWSHAGLVATWYKDEKDEGDQDLPIARGNDFEVIGLFKMPTSWPLHLNVGYLFRDDYQTKGGISGGTPFTIQPGNIFESRASLEIPLKFHFSLLSEVAYYQVESQKINNKTIKNSDGEALDVLGGLTWNYGSWALGGGVLFGMLEESHTSFDIERGAGDIAFKLALAFKLKPKKPNR